MASWVWIWLGDTSTWRYREYWEYRERHWKWEEKTVVSGMCTPLNVLAGNGRLRTARQRHRVDHSASQVCCSIPRHRTTPTVDLSLQCQWQGEPQFPIVGSQVSLWEDKAMCKETLPACFKTEVSPHRDDDPCTDRLATNWFTMVSLSWEGKLIQCSNGVCAQLYYTNRLLNCCLTFDDSLSLFSFPIFQLAL